ncbi:hypothetical protein M8C13_19845 [Crossiella sp. SN42]|uniref:hypothetical protein n=1 Tax=Crossiella sp. SN42 TaxID=2944808 RepID=UPI00207CAE70|nr:hypothetical protein [Crossiella sp. SN42]MCO1578008.1 hypothetical protein [Crossiella sp. SN42]
MGIDPDVINFRPDAETREALRVLMRACKADRSTVIRRAIVQAAHEVEATQAAEDLRAEAARVAASESDRAEVAAVQEELADLRAW